MATSYVCDRDSARKRDFMRTPYQRILRVVPKVRGAIVELWIAGEKGGGGGDLHDPTLRALQQLDVIESEARTAKLDAEDPLP